MKKNSLYTLIIGIVLVMSISSCSNTTGTEEEIDLNPIKVLEVTVVDSVVADFPVAFKLLTTIDWKFIAYYNKHRELTVASKEKSQSNWNYKTLPTKVGWDSHNRITMALDRENCIHVTGNMHNDSLTYFKTERPNDISTFRRVFPMVTLDDELRCTYPTFIKNSNRELIYTYRKGGSGNGINISNIYDEESKSFRRLTDKPLFDGLGEMSAYASGPMLGSDNFFHIIWLWRDTPGCETNHDLSYAKSEDLINWKTANGSQFELPITPTLSQFTVDPVPAKGGAINGVDVLFFGSQGQPLIAYMKYDEEAKSQIYLAGLEDNKWVSKQVSYWDYRWNFSGPGSISSEIRINDCFIGLEDEIVITYNHIKYGFGKLVVDQSTLKFVEDRQMRKYENSHYPAELLTPISNIDSASVNWLKSNTIDDNPNEYYALRWETMGKRRFYKPREKPVKPSALVLYKFSKNP